MITTALKLQKLALLVFLFLLPWQTRWIFEEGMLSGGAWEYGTISVYVTEILIFAYLLFQSKYSAIQYKTSRVSEAVYWILIIFLCLVFFSLNWAPDVRVATIAALHLFFTGIVIFLIGRTSVSKSEMVSAFIFGVVAQAVLGMAQITAQYVSASTWLGIAVHDPSALGTSVVETMFGRFLRAYGGLPHPNILGGYLAVGLIFLLPLIIKENIAWRRGLLWGSIMLLTTVLFLTFSRSAWLGAIVGIVFSFTFIFLLSQKFERKISVAFLGVFILASLTLSLVFSDTVAGRIKGGTYLEDLSTSERILGVKQSMVLIKENLWLGVGVGNYTKALAQAYPGEESWVYQPVHNTFLLLLAEVGVVGVALGALIFGIILVYSVILLFRKPDPWVVASIGALLTLGVISLFDHYLWSLYPGLLLAAFVIGFWNQVINKKLV